MLEIFANIYYLQFYAYTNWYGKNLAANSDANCQTPKRHRSSFTVYT